MTLTIRAAEHSDYIALCEIMSQPNAQANTLQLPMPSQEKWKNRLAEFPTTDQLLVAQLDDKVIGHLGIHAASKSLRMRHVYGIGMAVHDAYTRRGAGAALVEAALNITDNWLQATRVELNVFVDNAPAIALYKKFGFEVEGTMHKYAFRNGVYVDTHVMGRVKD